MAERFFDRRAFLKGTGLLAGAAALAGCSDASSSATSVPAHPKHHPMRPSVPEVSFDSEGLPIARWLVEENEKEGSDAWHVHGPPPGGVEGYLSRASAAPGEELTLYVNSSARRLNVKAFRMGWYQGHGARLVADFGSAPARPQAAPGFTAGVNTTECHWKPTMDIEVGKQWPTGYYLIHLGTDRGWSQWVPLVVRDDSSTSHIVVQSSMTTWQAYSLWGGYSLYFGNAPGGGQSYENRARVVSFDKPYAPGWENGSADFFGNEYPFVALVERLGVDVSYWTDVDLHERPELCENHGCLVSLGHDEYWSAEMRYGVESAVRKGLNFAVLGANCCYRHIRFADSPLGENRRQICYKEASEDPLYGKENSEVTADWNEPPDPRPESALIGIMYQAYGGAGDMIVVDPAHRFFDGTELKEGSRIKDAIGSEFDRYVPGAPTPPGVQLLCHSPTPSALGRLTADMSYYTVPGGGGVFATGTACFVDRLWDNQGTFSKPFAPGPVAGSTEHVTKITKNVLAEFSKGPASSHLPSEENWQHFYSGSATAPPPVDAGTTT